MISFNDDANLEEPASAIPTDCIPYKRTPEFTEHTVPQGLLKAHSTKAGVWGRICLTGGELVYRIVDLRRRAREEVLHPGTDGVVEPEILHEVQTKGPVTFYVEFSRVIVADTPATNVR